MAKISSAVGVTASETPIKHARLVWQSLRKAGVHAAVDRTTRVAATACAAIALTGITFGTGEAPALLKMGPPLVGLGLALPLVMALWMPAISLRRARLLAAMAAVLLAGLGAACYSRATALQVILCCFVPSILLLLASDDLTGSA